MYCNIKKCICHKKIIRALSTNEISTALRPFYFIVHPDLFGQFPTQRTVNENSLKLLSSAIETLQQKQVIKPTTLVFYLRPRDEKALKDGKFTLVHINLNEQDLKKTIISILKTCNLPTTFVDQIKDQKSSGKNFDMKYNLWEENFFGQNINFSGLENDPIYASILMRKKITSVPDTLKAYLEKHVNDAHIKFEACKPIRSEVKKLETILCTDLGLKQIIWDCGWNITHYRGCLLSFQALAHHHPKSMEVLRGRTLVFANGTGISLEGNVMLNSGEVRHNWHDTDLQQYNGCGKVLYGRFVRDTTMSHHPVHNSLSVISMVCLHKQGVWLHHRCLNPYLSC